MILIIKRARQFLLRPFRTGPSGVDFPLLALFLLVNGIVLWNSCHHEIHVGYDAYAHLDNVKALAKMRLPTADDSLEFFSPPLPYLFPAALVRFAGLSLASAARGALLVNALISVALTLLLLHACELIRPGSAMKRATLGGLALFTVYYRTFSFVRGEPYVAFFSLAIVYLTILIAIKGRQTRTNGLLLGAAMGLCALSRQWGFFPIASSFLFMGL